MTGPAAGDRIKVGAHLPQLTESVRAVKRHDIGFAHLAVLARTASRTQPSFDETELLGRALECSPGKLIHVCWKYWHARDPKGFAQEQANQIENRALRLNSWADGTVTLSGIFDPVGGAAIRTALEPLAEPLGPDDRREREQRMADALVEVVSGGEQKAQIQVTARSRWWPAWSDPRRRMSCSRSRFAPRPCGAWPATRQ